MARRRPATPEQLRTLERHLLERQWAPALAILTEGIGVRQLRQGVLPVVEARRLDVLRALLDAGTDPDRQHPLCLAAASGWAEGAALLLEGGADPAKGPLSGPPLWAAISRGHDGLAAVLVRAGAPLEIPASRGPLLVGAAFRGLTATVSAMLEKGADPDARGDVQATRQGALFVLETNETLHANAPAVVAAAAEGHTAVVELLISAGADLEAHDDHGTTALEAARRAGHRDVAERLQRAGAPREARVTPEEALIAAVEGGNASEVERLVSGGASANAADRRSEHRGRTPLIHAVRLDRPALVDALLASGADPDLRDGDERLPLGELGLARPADLEREPWRRAMTPLMYAAVLGRDACAGRLLAAGAGPDLVDAAGYSALMLAAGNGRAGIVEALLAAGADPNLRGHYRMTALFCAASDGHARVAKLLLGAGARPGSRDRAGHTALDMARLLGDADLVATLVRAETGRPR